MEEAGEGGGAGGVGRPLAKSDFAKRQPRLFCSAFPPAAQAGGQAGRLAESLTEAAAPAAGVAGKFSAAHFAPPLA